MRHGTTGARMATGILGLACALGAGPGMGAESTRLGPSCDLAVVGASEAGTFLRFDRELRAALTARDGVALGALVDYPLHLDHEDGSVTSLDNARAVQTRLEAAFPRAVRTIVLESDVKSLFCNAEGAMYGDGAVWVALVGEGTAQRYRVISVNLPDGVPPGSAPAVDFICEAARHRVVIDTSRAGAVRYRAWTRPHPLTDPADIELSGTVRGEGTGPCAHAIWTFKGAQAVYTVTERGCSEAATDDIGELRVATPGKADLHWPCY